MGRFRRSEPSITGSEIVASGGASPCLEERSKVGGARKLKQVFFSFRCSEKLNLDMLPVMGISSAPVKTLDDFTDWLTDVQSRYPNLEITLPANLDEWEDHLAKIGLDPLCFISKS